MKRIDSATAPQLAAAAEALLRLQTPDGALPMRDGSSVVPYFANFGAIGLCAAANAGVASAGRCRDAARRWALWYDARRNADGTIYDFKGAPGAWVPTGKFDSTDSYASTYIELIRELFRTDGDVAWLRGRYPFVRRSLAAMALTRQKNGLTTATPKWPVMYTMDNVEVLRGLRAAVELAAAVGSAADARECASAASTAAASIARDLWDARNDCFIVGLQIDGGRMAGLKSWYPDLMANLMAIGWLPADTDRLPALYRRLWTRFSADPNLGAPTAVRTAGDRERLTWWGYAARAQGSPADFDTIRKALAASVSIRVPADDPAVLGHICRLSAPPEKPQ